jgi:hypothetical protein
MDWLMVQTRWIFTPFKPINLFRWVQCKYPCKIMGINWLLDAIWDFVKK